MERSWGRHHGLVALRTVEAEALVRVAFPGTHVLAVEPLSGGLRNTNLRITTEGGPSPLVLRLYTADPAACAREAGVLRALPAVVLAPRVLHAEPHDDTPWALLSWLEGSPMDVALRLCSRAEALMLAGDCGAALAAIHTIHFPRSGFLGPNLALGVSLGTWSGTMGSLLEGQAGRRLGIDRAALLRTFAARHAPEMDPLFATATLCHGDYKPWNLLARAAGGAADRRRFAGIAGWGLAGADSLSEGADRPRLAGIVDWEFAFAGPPLFDVGTFLRDESRLPAGFRDAFAAGYRRLGGELRGDWRRLARRLDLVNICQLLERGDDRRDVDLVPLIDATLGED